jgi:hypothetical protein
MKRLEEDLAGGKRGGAGKVGWEFPGRESRGLQELVSGPAANPVQAFRPGDDKKIQERSSMLRWR